MLKSNQTWMVAETCILSTSWPSQYAENTALSKKRHILCECATLGTLRNGVLEKFQFLIKEIKDISRNQMYIFVGDSGLFLALQITNEEWVCRSRIE